MRSLVGFVRGVISRYGSLGGSNFAAAISYRALFSLLPLATFVATILAEILSRSRLGRRDLVSTMAERFDLSPDGADKLDTLITSVPSPWSLAGLFTLGLALWGASSVMGTMQSTLAAVFDEGASRSLVRGRLVSALLVLGALGLILCAVAVSALENVASKVNDDVDAWLGWQPPGFGVVLGAVAPAALILAVFVLLYRYLPQQRASWRAVLVGATAGAVLFQAVQLGLGWYLAGPADFGEVYGSASAVFAFLFSVYLGASVFVLCAVLTAEIDEKWKRVEGIEPS